MPIYVKHRAKMDDPLEVLWPEISMLFTTTLSLLTKYKYLIVILLLLQTFLNLTRIVYCILAAGTDGNVVPLRGGKDNTGCLQTL